MESDASCSLSVVLHETDNGPSSGKESLLSSKISQKEDLELIKPKNKGKASLINPLFSEDSPAFFLAGYGASRWTSGSDQFETPSSHRRIRGARYQRVASLFEDHFGLMPLELWLPKIAYNRPKRFPEIVALMDSLLPKDTRMIGVLESITGKAAFTFEQDGIPLPITALSDGYRSYICWLADLLYHLSTCCPDHMALNELPGLVLVDEIDLHLHPEWQMMVLEKIAETFPILQFVMTTHSPIVAGTHKGRLFVTEKDEGRATVIEGEEDIYGKNADQILRSLYFGLKTTRAEGFHNRFLELTERVREGDDSAALEALEILSTGSRGS